MDAIVVERKSTAIEMAQFLSSNRAMLRETILPLDTLDPPQVKERLRQLGGTRKLVADVMTFDTKFTKVCISCIHELLPVKLTLLPCARCADCNRLALLFFFLGRRICLCQCCALRNLRRRT